jgi:hypothetical protein
VYIPVARHSANAGADDSHVHSALHAASCAEQLDFAQAVHPETVAPASPIVASGSAIVVMSLPAGQGPKDASGGAEGSLLGLHEARQFCARQLPSGRPVDSAWKPRRPRHSPKR